MISFVPAVVVRLIVGIFVVEESALHGVGIVRFRRTGAGGCRRRVIDRSAPGTHFRFRIISTAETSGPGSCSYWSIVPAVMLRPSTPLGSVHLLHHVEFTFRIVVKPVPKVFLLLIVGINRPGPFNQIGRRNYFDS